MASDHYNSAVLVAASLCDGRKTMFTVAFEN
jgi:hypothetical protein